MMAPLTPPHQGAGHALVPGPEHDVVIGHHGHRHRDLGPGDAVEHLIGDGAPLQPQSGLLDHRAVHHRIREGDADLHGVGPGGHHRGQGLPPVVGHAPHEVGDQELAPPPVGPARLFKHGRGSPKISRTWATSLSPRPDRVMRTVEPLGRASVPAPGHPGHGMGRLEGRDDALGLAQERKASSTSSSLAVCTRPGRWRPDGRARAQARVVQPGRDGFRLLDLPGLVLQEARVHAVQDAGIPLVMAAPPAASTPTSGPRCRRSRRTSRPRWSRRRHRPRPRRGRCPSRRCPGLPARLVAHHPLQLAHHVGEGVRAHDRAQAVVRVLHRGHPLAHGLVHRVLQRAAPRGTVAPRPPAAPSGRR
jgi:hypothetical protein